MPPGLGEKAKTFLKSVDVERPTIWDTANFIPGKTRTVVYTTAGASFTLPTCPPNRMQLMVYAGIKNDKRCATAQLNLFAKQDGKAVTLKGNDAYSWSVCTSNMSPAAIVGWTMPPIAVEGEAFQVADTSFQLGDTCVFYVRYFEVDV